MRVASQGIYAALFSFLHSTFVPFSSFRLQEGQGFKNLHSKSSDFEFSVLDLWTKNLIRTLAINTKAILVLLVKTYLVLFKIC